MVKLYVTLVVTVSTIILLIPLLDGVERKFVRARIQSRIGPPILQTYYDLVKLFRKELLVPSTSSKLFIIAPVVSFFTSLAALTILPYTLSSPLGFEGDLILLIYLLIFSSLAVLLGGLASGNQFAEVSSSRELSVLMSSELLLGLAVAVIALKHSSLSLSKISSTLVITPSTALAYIALLYYSFIKSARTPYDIAEAEPEIASGYLIEYSGPLLAFSILSNLIRRFIVSSIFTLLCFGPLISSLTSLVGNEGFRYAVNSILTILLNVVAYLSLGAVSAIHGRYRVVHAIESIKKYTIIPIAALILAIGGF